MKSEFKSKGLLVGLGCLLFIFALMFGAILGGNSMTVYAAEENHAHCICGGGVESGDHTSHSDVTFSPYSGGDVTYDETGTAYLYLASESEEVYNSKILTINSGYTLYLCLNGHSLQNSYRPDNVIDISSGGKLILCDCKGTGWIGGRTSGANSGAVWVNGTFTMYSGNLQNSIGLKNGGGLYLTGNGSATMYGGTISNNFAFADGGGVFLNGTSSFTMYGGSISGNRATDEGGGVFVKTGTTFTMYGGVIENNKNGSNGGGVFVSGEFTMNGGSIRKNTAAGRGGGICAENGGVITLNKGAIIENNVAHGNGGGISACWGATFTMKGGVVKSNESGINGGGIFLFGNGGWSKATSTFEIMGGTVTKNKAGGVGGGIYLYEYTNFKMNATTDIIIMDNEGSNLYLTDYSNNKKDEYVIELTFLTPDSRIGVTALRNPWVIFTEVKDDYSSLFSSDSDKYHIGYDPVNEVLGLTTHVLKKVNRIEPDCTHDGKEEYWSCECGKYFEDAEGTVMITDISTWGILRAYHTTLTKVDKVAPDCTRDGKEEYWSCSVCGKYYADEAGTVEITNIDEWGILPSHHTLTKVDKVAPDCTNNGKEAYWSCSACNKYFEDEAATVEITDISTWGILPASRHTLTKENKVAPGCTNNGKEAYWSCSACNKYFEDEAATVEIADIGTWGILPVQHTFTDLIAEVAATCASEGVKAHKDCKICNKHFDADGNEIADLTIAVDSTAHRFGKWIEEVPATEDAEGVKGHKDCDFCHKHFDANGNEITDLTIAKLTNGEEEPGEEPEKSGLSAGAIVGITLGSVAVAEMGGFSLLWFVIKKKKFADLIASIKGIF
ncbi:MAG: hypothetical protein ACI3XS_06405 [Eubacteriales bacterium]